MPVLLSPVPPTTSGTAQINGTRDVVIRRALRMIGAYTSTDLPRPEQLNDANTVLNMMLKAWSVDGLLWLREFFELPLVGGQTSYLIGPAGTPASQRPEHVYNATRKTTSGNEIPIIPLTRSDYMNIPNKSNSYSPPVQFYYHATTLNGTLYVWPTPPLNTTDVLVLDMDRQLDIMADNINAFDFPDKWLETISYNLAARMAPEYGIQLGERQKLEDTALYLFNKLADDDRDIASIHFEVRRP